MGQGEAMSNDKRQAWRTVSDEVMSTYADSPMGTTHAVEMAAEKGYDLGKYHGMVDANLVAIAMVSGGKDLKLSGPSMDTLSDEIRWANEKSFAAGLTRARDLLATQADESEALARGQAAEAEQVQKRAAASATRAAVQRAQVATLDREIAALKGEGK